VVGLFVRLKLTLIRNGFRGGWQRRVGLIVGALTALPLALMGFAVLATVRPASSSARQLVVLGCTSLFVSWIGLPVLGFGADETLDPSRLAVLPLRRRQLMTGLLAASFIGVAPLATLLGLTGAVVGFTTSPLSLVLVSLCVMIEVLLCVTACRATVTALSRMLRSRRGRDVSVLIVALVALLPQLLRLAIPGDIGAELDLSPAVGWARWTPPGWVGQSMVDAATGHSLKALGGIAVGIVTLLALVAGWAIALERSLTSAEATQSTRTGGTTVDAGGQAHGRPLFPRVALFLPVDRVGAVAARELRYIVRDPRRRVQLLYGILMPVFIVLPVLARGSLHREAAVLAAVTVSFFSGGLTGLNQFGVDGAAYWMNVVAGNDPGSDMLGKNTAAVLIALPATTVIAFGLAAYTGGWRYVPIAIAASMAVLAVCLGVGNVVSVLAPQPMPDAVGNVWAQRSGAGCATGMISMLARLIEMLLLLPVGLAVLAAATWPLSGTVTMAVSLVYGWLLWRLGLRMAVRRVWWRLPELLDMLSPKQAA
jgi:ABC-2 type transport system permease protein